MGTSSEPQLLQLKYRYEPWKLLVACILLNRTTRRQVDRVIDDLFLDYPTYDALAEARFYDLATLLYPLGMHNTRAKRLIKFARAFQDMESSGVLVNSKEDAMRAVADLPGVGEYALDSYAMFVLGDLSVKPTDKELVKWQAWQLFQAESTHRH